MSNPYEQILRPKPPLKPLDPKPPTDSRSTPSAVLSRANRKRPVIKPHIRFNVHPRFRFNLPDPPMDPKMLLGPLSTASYARPYVTQLEKDFRPPAIPAEPAHGLHPNLVESLLYTRPARLSFDDDALLLSVMSGRPGASSAASLDIAARGAQKPGVLPAPLKQSPISSAPWMRRMSYDEYRGGSVTVARHKLTAKEEAEAAEKLAHQRKNDPKVREKRRRALLQSFDEAKKMPMHPDKRKATLRPVSITPVFPDFGQLGKTFTVLEFDKDDNLTTDERLREEDDAAVQSVRTMATLVVGNESEIKKHIACYTPTDKTLAQRKRRRERDEESNEMETRSSEIHFAEEETYQWLSEFSVRVGRYGNQVEDGVPSRSCYALTEQVSKDSMTRIAVLARVETGWKLSKRPGTLPPLGEKRVMIRRTMKRKDNEKKKRRLLEGADIKVKVEPKQMV